MTKKVRVQLAGFQKRSVLIDAHATEGAVIGKDLYWPDGEPVTRADIENPTGGGGDTEETQQVTLWELIVGIPAIIKSLIALVGPGYIYHNGTDLAAHEHPLHDVRVEAGEVLTIPDNKQYIVFDDFFVDGELILEGDGELIIFREPQPDPLGPDLTFNVSDQLTQIDYDDGSQKILSYNVGGQLEQVDFIRDGVTFRKSLFYDGGGKLDYVDENYV